MSVGDVSAVALAALLVGVVPLAIALTARAVWPRVVAWRERRETRAVARGEQGVMAALTLYRERVVARLTAPRAMGMLGRFSVERMYTPLELEVAPLGRESVRYYQPDELLRKHSRVVILGPPGAGKTTMLQYMALLTARGAVAGLPDLPVFMPLSEVAREDGTLVDSACRVIAARYDIALSRDQFLALLEGGLLVLLLDGLDELAAGSGAYDHVLDQISELIDLFPKNPIMISCRTAAWTSTMRGFREATISPLDDATIRRFIVARFHAEASDLVESLYRIVAGSRPLRELARNPLFLSLIVGMYQLRGELPRSRVELYEGCTELLLYEWDRLRMVDRPTKLPLHLKYQLLKRLGLLLQSRHLPTIAEADLLAQVAEWFSPDVYGPPRLIVGEIEVGHGVLVKSGVDSYGFLHITFQQYFAALEIAEARPLPPYFLSQLDSPWWREVSVLVSAMGRADEVVGAIIGAVRKSDLPEAHSKLLLAAECVRESPSLDPALRRKVVHRLKFMFLKSDDDATYQAAMAMARLGRQPLEDFLEDRLRRFERPCERAAAALALAELGRSDAEVVDVLLESLRARPLDARTRAARALGQLRSGDVLDALLSALLQEDSAQARAEILRAINSTVEVPELDTATLALTIKTLRSARQDADPVVSGLAIEVLDRVSSRLRE